MWYPRCDHNDSKEHCQVSIHASNSMDSLVACVIMSRKELVMLTLDSVQSILRVSRWTLYAWIREGKLEALRLPSGRFMVPEREVERIKNNRAQRAKSTPRDDGVLRKALGCSPSSVCEDTAGERAISQP